MGEATQARLTPAGRVAALLFVASAYTPWWAQRRFMSSRAVIRVVVAGRQAGKTHCAAEEVVRLMLLRPGSTSCLLMPTYKSTKGPLKHLRRALSALGPHGQRWRWREVDKCFRLGNGSELYVRTADDKEGVPTRGLTVDGVLWVDEAAYVPREAWEAARNTQGAVRDARVIVTGSPCGRNWLYEEYNAGLPGPKRSKLNESFRFKTTDSPYHNPDFVEDQRKKLSMARFKQELEAEFLGDAHAAFDPEDIAAMFVNSLTVRGSQLTIGADLGKEQDFTVLTLMNEFGEAWVLARFRDVGYPEIEAKLVDLATKHNALVVVDTGNGPGAALFGYLERSKLGKGRVLGVMTSSLKAKGLVIETLRSDVENRRIKAQADERGQILRHEMTFFEAHRILRPTGEEWRYHGPEGVARDDEDEENEDHDDCVISLALANWGRVNGWEQHMDPLAGDHSGFATGDHVDPGSLGGYGGVGGGSYIL